MKGFNSNIEKDALKNENFRKVLKILGKKLIPTMISFSGSKVERANALLMEMNIKWKMVMLLLYLLELSIM